MVSASAGIMKKMLATAAKSTTIMPMNRNLPRKLKSFLVTVATPASVKRSRPCRRPHGDQRAPVGKAQGVLQDAREHQAHEEGEAQQERHAEAAVLGTLDAPHEGKGDAHEHEEGNHRAAGEERSAAAHQAMRGTIDSASSR